MKDNPLSLFENNNMEDKTAALPTVSTGDRKPVSAPIDNSATAIGTIPDLTKTSHRLTPYLRIVHPEEYSYNRFKLTEKSLFMGRSQATDIPLDDHQVSRVHCKITSTGSVVMVEDLGSTNGTRIGDQSITKAELPIDGRLQVGRFIFKLEYKDESEISYDNKLVTAATTDALTGINNRQYFMEHAIVEMKKATMMDCPICIVMIDIDLFKKTNDTYGHQAGDLVIKSVAQILSKEKRRRDLLARYGGEEFIMLLPDTPEKGGIIFGEQLRNKVEKYQFEFQGSLIPTTISIGFCCRVGKVVTSLDKLIGYADEALYDAKKQGRNRVALHAMQ